MTVWTHFAQGVAAAACVAVLASCGGGSTVAVVKAPADVTVADVAGDAQSSDTAKDIGSDSAADATSATAKDSLVDAQLDSQVADTAQDTAQDTVPDVAPDAVPDVVPDAAPDSVPAGDVVADTGGISCAKAVILSGQIKGRYLELAAAASTTDGTPATGYAWTAQVPVGPPQWASGAAAATAKLGPLLYQGSYTVCLQVQTAGQPSCAPTCQTYAFSPGIYIELTWLTPAASDPSGAGAADLNLHLANDQAGDGKDWDCDGQPDPWYDEQNAAFWLNPTPDWGQSGLLADDPLVDDAPNPLKPEVIYIDKPAPGTYQLAVHALNDKLAGPSLANISVYVAGVQLLQLSGISLKQSDLWIVGKLVVPPGGASAAWLACSQSADACQSGGKLWQSAGDLCTTPCYEYAGLFSKPSPGCAWKWP